MWIRLDLVARISPRLRLGRSTSTFRSRATTTLWLFHTFFRGIWGSRRGPRPVRSLSEPRGPRPVRSLSEPRGLARLRERDRAIRGNIFADFALGLLLTRLNSSSWSSRKKLGLCRPGAPPGYNVAVASARRLGEPWATLCLLAPV